MNRKINLRPLLFDPINFRWKQSKYCRRKRFFLIFIEPTNFRMIRIWEFAPERNRERGDTGETEGGRQREKSIIKPQNQMRHVAKVRQYRLIDTREMRSRNIQAIQLALTNRATHLCKCNDVADLTSVINIRLKKNDSSHPAFQGHSRSLEPTRIDPPSMISY